jgi:hypothetical protein
MCCIRKNGKLKIEPLTLSVDVQLPQTVRICLVEWCLLKQQRKFRLEPKPSTLNHCQAGKPEDLGAVGSFDFKVTPSKTTLKHDESLDLVVSETEGNLKLFSLPKPMVPNALEMVNCSS